MLLTHECVAFEDIRITFQDWPNWKPKMKGGKVPNLELEDGTVINQTQAIMKYLGRIYGYIPEDPL